MKGNKAKKRISEKILSIFAWFAFAIAILTAMLSIFSSFSGEKNGKELFGVKFLIVASDSMSRSTISEDEPIYFDAGDLVIIRTTSDGTEYKEGDVISFLSRNPDSYGKTLTHKIRQVNYSPSGQLISYTTYGICTGVNDRAVVSPDTILGSYAGKIPKVGNLLSYLKTPLGYYLSILTPAILLIIFFSIKVGKYLGRKEAVNEYSYGQEIEQLKERIALLEGKNEISATAEETQNEISSTVETAQSVLLPEIVDDDNAFSIASNKRTSFSEKLLSLEKSVQEYFNSLHNELVSYKKVRGRLSFKGVSYRTGRKLLAKITVRGKTLKLHLGLNVEEFNKNVFFQQDYSDVKAYVEVPFTVKVKSNRAEKNAVKLITELMAKNGVAKNDKYTRVNALTTFINQTQEENSEVVDNDYEQTFSSIAKKSFAEKLLSIDQSVKDYFDTLHNELVSYKKVHGRVSLRCSSYRMGRKLLAKMTIRGKTLKLHLALNVDEFNKNAFFQQDYSNIKAYEQVPFTVKVKSARGEKNAVKLITELMAKNGAIKNQSK